MQHTYEVAGMKCDACVEKVENALKNVPGINNVTVELKPPQAKVKMDSHISINLLNDAAKRAGGYSLKEDSTSHAMTMTQNEAPESLRPLFIIVGYIVGAVLLRGIISSDFSPHTLMINFMGGFFVVFSLFKMIDLSGFADGYSSYDILAKRSRVYAFAYPFIELGLGISYFSSFQPLLTNVFTFVLMSIGAVGVFQALRQKRTIQCACVGTALKLPMTKTTLIEDLVMALMAGFMLTGF